MVACRVLPLTWKSLSAFKRIICWPGSMTAETELTKRLSKIEVTFSRTSNKYWNLEIIYRLMGADMVLNAQKLICLETASRWLHGTLIFLSIPAASSLERLPLGRRSFRNSAPIRRFGNTQPTISRNTIDARTDRYGICHKWHLCKIFLGTGKIVKN